MKKLSLVISALVLLAYGTVKADSGDDQHQVTIGINAHALVDVESASGSSSISLSPVAPSEAGLGLDFSNAVNTDLWLNYSSIVSSNDKKNKIFAKINGTLPTGVSLELAVSDPVEGGAGRVGAPKNGNGNKITLTDSEQEVIHNIRSCYTGNNAGNGHNLTYSLKLDEESDYGDITESSADVNIVYTIIEE